MASRHLSNRQQEVLGRLLLGEPITRRGEPAAAVTVYALRNRGLVITKRQPGGDWTAELTDAGRQAATTGWVPRHFPVPHGRASREPVPVVAPPREARTPRSLSPVRPMVAKPSPEADSAGRLLTNLGRPAVRADRALRPPKRRRDQVAEAVVRATGDSLKGQRADEKGLTRSAGDGVAKVKVSKGAVSRTLAILRVFFDEIRVQGGAVVVPQRFANGRSPTERFAVLEFSGISMASRYLRMQIGLGMKQLPQKSPRRCGISGIESQNGTIALPGGCVSSWRTPTPGPELPGGDLPMA